MSTRLLRGKTTSQRSTEHGLNTSVPSSESPIPSSNISTNPQERSQGGSGSDNALIFGAVLGGVTLYALVMYMFFVKRWCRPRHSVTSPSAGGKNSSVSPEEAAAWHGSLGNGGQANKGFVFPEFQMPRGADVSVEIGSEAGTSASSKQTGSQQNATAGTGGSTPQDQKKEKVPKEGSPKGSSKSDPTHRRSKSKNSVASATGSAAAVAGSKSAAEIFDERFGERNKDFARRVASENPRNAKKRRDSSKSSRHRDREERRHRDGRKSEKKQRKKDKKEEKKARKERERLDAKATRQRWKETWYEHQQQLNAEGLAGLDASAMANGEVNGIFYPGLNPPSTSMFTSSDCTGTSDTGSVSISGTSGWEADGGEGETTADDVEKASEYTQETVDTGYSGLSHATGGLNSTFTSGYVSGSMSGLSGMKRGHLGDIDGHVFRKRQWAPASKKVFEQPLPQEPVTKQKDDAHSASEGTTRRPRERDNYHGVLHSSRPASRSSSRHPSTGRPQSRHGATRPGSSQQSSRSPSRTGRSAEGGRRSDEDEASVTMDREPWKTDADKTDVESKKGGAAAFVSASRASTASTRSETEVDKESDGPVIREVHPQENQAQETQATSKTSSASSTSQSQTSSASDKTSSESPSAPSQKEKDNQSPSDEQPSSPRPVGRREPVSGEDADAKEAEAEAEESEKAQAKAARANLLFADAKRVATDMFANLKEGNFDFLFGNSKAQPRSRYGAYRANEEPVGAHGAGADGTGGTAGVERVIGTPPSWAFRNDTKAAEDPGTSNLQERLRRAEMERMAQSATSHNLPHFDFHTTKLPSPHGGRQGWRDHRESAHGGRAEPPAEPYRGRGKRQYVGGSANGRRADADAFPKFTGAQSQADFDSWFDGVAHGVRDTGFRPPRPERSERDHPGGRSTKLPRVNLERPGPPRPEKSHSQKQERQKSKDQHYAEQSARYYQETHFPDPPRERRGGSGPPPTPDAGWDRNCTGAHYDAEEDDVLPQREHAPPGANPMSARKFFRVRPGGRPTRPENLPKPPAKDPSAQREQNARPQVPREEAKPQPQAQPKQPKPQPKPQQARAPPPPKREREQKQAKPAASAPPANAFAPFTFIKDEGPEIQRLTAAVAKDLKTEYERGLRAVEGFNRELELVQSLKLRGSGPDGRPSSRELGAARATLRLKKLKEECEECEKSRRSLLKYLRLNWHPDKCSAAEKQSAARVFQYVEESKATLMSCSEGLVKE